jgi:hypothetical protein
MQTCITIGEIKVHQKALLQYLGMDVDLLSGKDISTKFAPIPE